MIAADSKLILAPDGRPAFLKALENNWYEGSRWSPNRSWVWFPLQDAKRDLDRFTRYELNKHARYLYKNSPFTRGLIERLVSLTVGSGFKPVFKSESNPAWPRKAKKWWAKKSRNINLGPRATFSQYQRAVGRARFLDGGCFSIKTFDALIDFQNKVQGVEDDRCTGGSHEQEQNNQTGNVDGCNLNAQGAVVSYTFRGVETPYPAEDVIHHFTPTRLGQYRGETILAAAINTARDVDDILALEKQSVKYASSKKDIIKKNSAELDPEQARLLRFGQQFGSVYSLPNDGGRAQNDYYKVQFGAETTILNPGDEYVPYMPERPGSAWQGFMDFLSNTICLSTNLPPSVLLPINVGGTDIRRDLDIAQRVVDPWQMDIACELDEILDYLIQPEIFDGELRGAPADWSVTWHFPPKINVDRAQAAQDRLDVQAGLMSIEEYHARYGDDGDEYDANVIAEAKRRKDRIMAAGFKDVLEFLQVMSMSAQAFNIKTEGEDSPHPQIKTSATATTK